MDQNEGGRAQVDRATDQIRLPSRAVRTEAGVSLTDLPETQTADRGAVNVVPAIETAPVMDGPASSGLDRRNGSQDPIGSSSPPGPLTRETSRLASPEHDQEDPDRGVLPIYRRARIASMSSVIGPGTRPTLNTALSPRSRLTVAPTARAALSTDRGLWITCG
jgi:hypothetical protein